jgi:Na+-translocating ferredoxin:NAD+ oxidoreductase subunit B
MSMNLALMTMGGLGGFFAVALAIADYKLRVEEDPRLEAVLDALPGANCGGCGLAGCGDFANRLLKEEVEATACPAGGTETLQQLSSILGLEIEESEAQVARLMCRGGHEMAKPAAEYQGLQSCSSRDMTGAGKGCTYGCLGGAECVEACPFDAMSMNAEGLPLIDESSCTGCGICVKACPRDLLEVHPVSRQTFVFCRSQDDPKRSKSLCSVACLGCAACVRKSNGELVMVGHLASIKKADVEIPQTAFDACKTAALSSLASSEGARVA